MSKNKSESTTSVEAPAPPSKADDKPAARSEQIDKQRLAMIRCACVRTPGDRVGLSVENLIALGLADQVPESIRDQYEKTEPSRRSNLTYGVLKVYVAAALAKASTK